MRGYDFAPPIMKHLLLAGSFLLVAPLASAQVVPTQFAAGHLFVASRNNNKIVEFDESLAKVREIDVSGFAVHPYFLAFGPNGNLFFTSEGTDKVVQMNLNGVKVNDFGPGTLSIPKGLVFGPKGNVYVASANNDLIAEYTVTGVPVRQFGSGATVSGPFGILIGPGGNIICSSFGTNEAVEFDVSGTFIRSIGAGSGLDSPRGIAILPNGNLGVTSQLPNPSVYEFDGSGTNVGAVAGVVGVSSAHGLTTGPDGNLYIASLDNDNVVKMAVDGTKLDEVGAPDGLSEATHAAFAPYRFKAKISGRLVTPALKVSTVSGTAEVSYVPGSRTVQVRLLDDPKKTNDTFDLLARTFLVFQGFEASGLDASKVRHFQGTETVWPTLSGGSSSYAAKVTGITSAAGHFIAKKLQGSIQIASQSGVFFGTLTTSTLLK